MNARNVRDGGTLKTTETAKYQSPHEKSGLPTWGRRDARDFLISASSRAGLNDQDVSGRAKLKTGRRRSFHLQSESGCSLAVRAIYIGDANRDFLARLVNQSVASPVRRHRPTLLPCSHLSDAKLRSQFCGQCSVHNFGQVGGSQRSSTLLYARRDHPCPVSHPPQLKVGGFSVSNKLTHEPCLCVAICDDIPLCWKSVPE